MPRADKRLAGARRYRARTEERWSWDIRVRQPHALAAAGRAARIKKDGIIVGIGIGRIYAGGALQQAFVDWRVWPGGIAECQQLGRPSGQRRLAKMPVKLRFGENALAVGVAKDMRDFRRGKAPINRYRHGAEPESGPFEFFRPKAVARQDGKSRPSAHSHGAQRGGQAGDAVAKVSPAIGARAVEDSRPRPIVPDCRLEGPDQICVEGHSAAPKLVGLQRPAVVPTRRGIAAAPAG